MRFRWALPLRLAASAVGAVVARSAALGFSDTNSEPTHLIRARLTFSTVSQGSSQANVGTVAFSLQFFAACLKVERYWFPD